MSEKRRARFGQRSCPRLSRSVGSSANHAKQIGRTRIGNPLARIPSDGLRDAPRASTDGLARIRKTDADSTISQPRYGRNQPPPNHEPPILRVESKNDTISTQPSYFSDSTTPTDTQKQFNLNHIKEGAAKVPRLMSLFPVRFSTTMKCWARQIRRDGERANRVLGMATR